MNLDSFVSRFADVRRAGNGYLVQCPAHEDDKNSLSIGLGNDGKIVLHCHAGCSFEQITEAGGINPKDLFADPESVVAQYIYCDEAGAPLYRVSRTAGKRFFQERFVNGDWISGLNGVRRVPYRLPEVLAADWICICEGEKDCDNLAALEMTATTNAGGASFAWPAEWAEYFRGKNVLIFPDNDEPGRAHAVKVGQLLFPVTKSLRIVELPGLPAKGDVSDYLAGHSKEQLFSQIREAKALTAPPEASKPEQGSLFGEAFSMKQIIEHKDTTRYLWAEALPYGGVGMLAGQPRAGKSTLALNLCLAIARGACFLNRATVRERTGYISIDNSIPEMKMIIEGLRAHESDGVSLWIGAIPGDPMLFLVDFVEKYGCKLLVIDTFQRFLGIKELNDSAECTRLMEPFNLEAARRGVAILWVHHSGKAYSNGTGALGSIAIKGMSPYYMELYKDEGARIFKSDFRGGKNFEDVHLKIDPATGWNEIAGSRFDAQIERVGEKIIEILGNEDGLTEREILEFLEIRHQIAGRALRVLLKQGKVERSGTPRSRTDPLRYSLAGSVLVARRGAEQKLQSDVNQKLVSSLNIIGNRGDGIDAVNHVFEGARVVKNQRLMMVPMNTGTKSELTGTNSEPSGTKSEPRKPSKKASRAVKCRQCASDMIDTETGNRCLKCGFENNWKSAEGELP